MRISLLVADDESPSHDLIRLVLAGWPEVRTKHVLSPAEAIVAAGKESFHLALVDLHYGKGKAEGFSLISQLKEIDPQMEIIVVSSAGDFEAVQAAMRAGASDFVVKGFGRAELLHSLERGMERRRWRRMEKRAQESSGFAMVGGSSALLKLQAELRKVAPKQVPVLLEGETGSGKEVAARALHHWGLDSAGPFVAVNCGAVPHSTADSYFFGHERGAFTGADRARIGVFEEADGGTLFLDEINSLSSDLQARLLRVLQEREIRRLGGSRNLAVNFRLVAASNQPLAKMVEAGSFREDLFYRLNVVTLTLPPLRERMEDLTALAAFFAPARSLSVELLTTFQNHRWPGNVRELRNTLLALDALADRGEELSITHLPEHVMRKFSAEIEEGGLVDLATFEQSQEEREREFLARAYRSCAGNVSRLARLLGADRSHLHQKLSKLGIHRAKE